MDSQELKLHFKSIVEGVMHIGGLDANKAFKIALSYIATSVGVQNAMIKTSTTVYDFLKNNIKLNEIKNTGIDFIGDVYNDLCIAPKNFTLLQEDIVDYAAKCVIEANNIKATGFPKSLLARDVRTGRMPLAIYNRVNGNVAIYGTEFDKMNYRIAITNLGLNDLLGCIRLVYLKEGEEAPKDTANEAWLYANMWNK